MFICPFQVQTATHFMTVSGPDRNNPDTIVHDLLTPCRLVITVFIIKHCTKRKSKTWFNLSLLQPRHKGSQGDDLDGRPRRKASRTKGSAIRSYTFSTGRKASETKVSAICRVLHAPKLHFLGTCFDSGVFQVDMADMLRSLATQKPTGEFYFPGPILAFQITYF